MHRRREVWWAAWFLFAGAVNSAPVAIGDEITRTVSWRYRADLSAVSGQVVRLRFGMCDADLYSLRFQP